MEHQGPRIIVRCRTIASRCTALGLRRTLPPWKEARDYLRPFPLLASQMKYIPVLRALYLLGVTSWLLNSETLERVGDVPGSGRGIVRRGTQEMRKCYQRAGEVCRDYGRMLSAQDFLDPFRFGATRHLDKIAVKLPARQ